MRKGLLDEDAYLHRVKMSVLDERLMSMVTGSHAFHDIILTLEYIADRYVSLPVSSRSSSDWQERLPFEPVS